MLRHKYPDLTIKTAFLLVPLLALVLAGCDLGSAETSQGSVQTVATATATSAPVAQPAVPAATTAASPTAVAPTVSSGGSTAPGEGGAPRTYTVQPGDTLSQIAEQFGVSTAELMAANDIASADLLQVDQELTIPSVGSVGSAGGQVGPTKAAVAASTPTLRAAAAVVAPTSTRVVVASVPSVTPPPVAGARNEPQNEPVVVNGRTYDAYIKAAVKKGQFFQYTCEFDAAWIVLKTYGIDVGLDDLVAAVGLDKSIEPYYKETKDGVVVYGGDITNTYSGDYKKNFLARSTGQAMRKAFEANGLKVTAVQDRPSLEAALRRGELVWIKTTVDFKPWVPVTWVMPDGRTAKGVLGNDHALVVMGFNKDVVVIRDPLGPTSTGRQRLYEYEVPWKKFMASWEAQAYDGLAVAPPGE